MSKRASRSLVEAPPTSPTHGRGEPAAPTEAEARARLAGFRSTAGRMTQEEFDALVAVAAPAEDVMAGQ